MNINGDSVEISNGTQNLRVERMLSSIFTIDTKEGMALLRRTSDNSFSLYNKSGVTLNGYILRDRGYVFSTWTLKNGAMIDFNYSEDSGWADFPAFVMWVYD